MRGAGTNPHVAGDCDHQYDEQHLLSTMPVTHLEVATFELEISSSLDGPVPQTTPCPGSREDQPKKLYTHVYTG